MGKGGGITELAIAYRHVPGGEKEFLATGEKIRASGKETDKTLGALDHTMEALGKRHHETAESGEALESVQEKLHESATELIGELVGLVAAYVSVKAAVDDVIEGVKEFAELDEALARLREESGATASGFLEMSERAKEIGASTVFGATDAAQAMELLSKAGLTTSEVMAHMTDVEHLAVIGHMSLAEAADAVALSLNRFNLSSDKAGHVVDVLATATKGTRASVQDIVDTMKQAGPAAAGLGVDFDDLAASLVVMTRNGGMARQVGGALLQAMSVLSNPTKEVVNNLKIMGLTVDQLSPRTHSLEQIVGTLAQKQLDLGTATALFGQTGGAAIMSLVSHAKDLQKVHDGLADVEGAGEKMAEGMENNLKAAGEKLEHAFDGFKISIGEGLAPALTEIAKMLTDLLLKGQDVGKIIGQAIGTGLKLIVDLILLVANHGRDLIAVLIGLAVAFAALKLGPLLIEFVAFVGDATLLEGAVYACIVSVEGLQAAWASLTASMAANPVGAVAVVLGVLVAVIAEFVLKARAAAEEEARYNEELRNGRPAIEGVTYAQDKLLANLREEVELREKLSHQVDGNKQRLAELQPILAQMKSALAAGDTSGYEKAAAAAERLGVVFSGLSHDSKLEQLQQQMEILGSTVEAQSKRITAANAEIDLSNKRLKEGLVGAIQDEVSARTEQVARIADLNVKVLVAKQNLKEMMDQEAVSTRDGFASGILKAANALGELEKNADNARAGLEKINKELALLAPKGRELAKELFSEGKYDEGIKIALAVGATRVEVDKAVNSWKAHNTAVEEARKKEEEEAKAREAALAKSREWQRLHADEILSYKKETEVMGLDITNQGKIAAAYRQSVAAGLQAASAAQIETKALQAGEKYKLAPELRAAIEDLVRKQERSHLATMVVIDTEQRLEQISIALAASRAKVSDVVHGNTDASMAAARAAEVLAFREKNLLAESDPRVQAMERETEARDRQIKMDAIAADSAQRTIDFQHAMMQAEAELADAKGRTTSNSNNLVAQLEIELRVRKLGKDITLEQFLAIIQEVTARQKRLETTKAETAAQILLNQARDAQAKAGADASDDQTRLDLELKYGSAVADLAVKLGAASEATRQLQVFEAARAAAAADGIAVGEEGWQRYLDNAQRYSDQLRKIQLDEAKLRASAEIWKPVSDAWQGVLQVGLDALNQWVETGHTSAKEIAKSLLDLLLKTFEQILINWIQLQVAMRAAQGAGGVAGGAGGLASGIAGQSAGSAAGSAAGNAAGGAAGQVAGGAAAGGGGYAAGTGALAGWAVVAIYVAIIIAVVAFIVNWVKTHASTKAQADIAIKDGQFALANAKGVHDRLQLLEQGVINPLIKELNDYIKGLHGVIQSMDVQIGMTRNGRSKGTVYRVYVTDEWGRQIVKNFGNDAKEAMQFAFYTALAHTKIDGLDPIVAAALKTAAAGAAAALKKGMSDAEKQAIDDEFNRLMGEAQQVASMGKPQAVAQLQDLGRSVDQLISDMLKLLGPSKEFDQAVQNITADMVQQLQAQRDSITGRQKTAQEEYQDRLNSAHLWNAELALRKLDLQARIDDLTAKIADAEATLSHGQVVGQHARVVIDSTGALIEATSMLGGVTQAELESMKANLAALQQILASMPNAIDDSEIAKPGSDKKGSKGSSGADAMSNLKEMIDAVAKAVRQSGMSDFQKQLDDLQEKWKKAIADVHMHSNALDQAKRAHEAAIKAAHGNADAIKKADEAYERATRNIKKQQEALDAANAARAQEIALMKKDLDSRVKDFTSKGTPGADVRDALSQIDSTAQGLIGDARSLHAAGGMTTQQLHQMVQAINAATAAQKAAVKEGVLNNVSDFLGGKGKTGLLGNLKDIGTTAQGLIDNLKALADAGQIGRYEMGLLSAKIIEEAKKQQDAAISNTQQGLLSDLYGYLHMDHEAAVQKYNITIAELDARRAELAAAMMTAHYTQEAMDAILGPIDDLIGKVKAGGPSLFENNDGKTAEQLQQEREQALQQLQQQRADDLKALTDQVQAWNDLALSEPEKQLRDLNNTFLEMQAKAKELGYDMSKLQSAYTVAINDFWKKLLQPLQDYKNSLDFSDVSPLSAEQKLKEAQAAFDKTAAAAQAGDLAAVQALPAAAQTLLDQARAFYNSGVGFQDIFAQVQAVLNQLLTNLPAHAPSPAAAALGNSPTINAANNILLFPTGNPSPTPAVAPTTQAATGQPIVVQVSGGDDGQTRAEVADLKAKLLELEQEILRVQLEAQAEREKTNELLTTLVTEIGEQNGWTKRLWGKLSGQGAGS